MALNVASIVSKVNKNELLRRGKPLVASTIKEFGKRAISQVGVETVFNMSNPRVTRYMKNWSTKRITGINETTRDRLQTVLTRGVKEGQQTDTLARAIGHVFDVAEGSRARSIARTETATASNFAAFEGYKQVGVNKKEWQATQDDVTRETHEELDGQTVELDDEFESSSGATAMYPGDFGVPEEDINCRCGVLPVVEEKRLRGNRRLMWKNLERTRKPWDRKFEKAMRAGFAAQRQAVMSAFNAQV